MNKEEIEKRKLYIEDMARDIFVDTVSHKTIQRDKMEVVAENSFEYAEFFYNFKKLHRHKK